MLLTGSALPSDRQENDGRCPSPGREYTWIMGVASAQIYLAAAFLQDESTRLATCGGCISRGYSRVIFEQCLCTRSVSKIIIGVLSLMNFPPIMLLPLLSCRGKDAYLSLAS